MACGDLLTPRKNIPGPYYLSENEGGNYWSLYFDLDDSGLGRLDSVTQIGWTDNFIFAENNHQYYFIDKRKDEGLLNANEIVVGPFDRNQFEHMIDSLNLKNFTFQMSF
jgi:hypothetical protein